MLFLLLGLVLLFGGQARAVTVNHNNLIDDGVFDNVNTLSAGQIDAWLNNNFPNSCISTNHGFEAREPSGYSPGGNFTYGGFVSAGQVIARSAQVYGINPQVLLVTLEKEQSLITGRNNFSGYCNNGDEHKYAAAVGYGCPDSGTTYNWSGVSLYRRNGVEHTETGTTCVNTAAKAGFSQQVIRAAWLLKFGEQRSKGNTSWAVINGSWNNSDDPQTCYGGPMTQGYRKRCSSDSSAVYYDGYISIDGSSTHMDTGGTSALYWYTPHFHGNEVFVTLFTSWFGSPFILSNGAPGKGGNSTSSWAPGRLDIFAQGVNGSGPNMYHKWWGGASWVGWEVTPAGSDRITSAPAAISWNTQRIDVFARGASGDLAHANYDTGWSSSWETLGGQIVGAPTVSSWQQGRMDIFVQGTSASGPNMFHKWLSNFKWFDWEQTPVGNNHITSAPTAVSWASGRIDVFARGESGELLHCWFDGSWHNWESLGGQIVGAPTVTSWSPGRLDIFAQGVNGSGPNMYHKWWSDNRWFNWELAPVGNSRISGAPTAVSWGSGRIDIFARGEGGDQLHSWFSGGNWASWESLGGVIAP